MSVHWVPDIHTEHPKSDRDAENRGGGGGGGGWEWTARQRRIERF